MGRPLDLSFPKKDNLKNSRSLSLKKKVSEEFALFSMGISYELSLLNYNISFPLMPCFFIEGLTLIYPWPG